MAYFEPGIDAEGIHIPTYNDIMEHLVSSYKSIFGDDVYIGAETKDYQLLSVFAKCIDDYAALVIDSYNARNPNYAEGDSLDLLLPLVSMRRRSATPSTVKLKLIGDANVELGSGLIAIDVNGHLWDISGEVILDGNGEAEADAVCEDKGAIPAPINSINGIYTPVVGWLGVTNEVEADLGMNLETDDELRLRRKQSVNISNNGLYDAMTRGLYSLNVDGETLKFVHVYANDGSNGESTDENGLPAHSVCCVVKGLDDAEDKIAEAIWKAKSPGVATYGGPEGTTRRAITYVDVAGNENVINFARPKETHVAVEITINALNGYDAERVDGIIKSTLLNSINILGIGEAWGVTTAYRDVYNAFSGEICPFVIASVTGQKTGMAEPSSVSVPSDFNELLIADDSDISIVVNE